MKRGNAPDTNRVSSDYAGMWTVWDREQTHILASGHTFEEAKQAAAAAGEQSVVMAKAPPAPLTRRVWRWSQVLAVFIALAPGVSSLANEIGVRSGQGTTTLSSSSLVDDSSDGPEFDEDAGT